jgi:Ca2+-binding EF-hand superfamily protein
MTEEEEIAFNQQLDERQQTRKEIRKRADSIAGHIKDARRVGAEMISESAECEAALAKMAKVIGSRSGLEDLEGLFRELDADGSGALDIDEFGEALSRFGVEQTNCNLDERFIAAIFNAVDVDKNGVVDFEEFARVAKCELELAIVKSAEVEETEARKIQQAVKAGVRVSRTGSFDYNLKMQGDLEMMTMAAVKERRDLKDEPGTWGIHIRFYANQFNGCFFSAEINELIQSWWADVAFKHRRRLAIGPLEKGEKEDMMDRMQKDSYAMLNIALHKHFVPEVSNEEAVVAADRDWEDDCPNGQDSMGYGGQITFPCRTAACPCILTISHIAI